MNPDLVEFIARAGEICPRIDDKVSSIKEYWMPDEPPITVLFGAIGDQVAENLIQDFEGQSHQIFDLIEQSFAEPDAILTVAVATGLVESMAGRLWRDGEIWHRAKELFGPRTRSHAEAWLAFV